MSINKMATATYTSKDQHWQDEKTTYWFEVDGHDNGTGASFENQVFGIAESGGDDTVVDCDGCPCTEGDAVTIAVRRVAIVTDDMRLDG